MGLFSFVKEAGGKLGSKIYDLTHDDENIADPVTISPERLNELRKATIERTVADMNLTVEGFCADVNGDTVVITGTVPSQEIREKLTLIAGNQHGIANVDCQIELAHIDVAGSDDAGIKVAVPEPAAEFYTVQSGDTLSKIAKDLLGNGNSYMKIFEANQPMLTDPDKIYVGQTLRIPTQA